MSTELNAIADKLAEAFEKQEDDDWVPTQCVTTKLCRLESNVPGRAAPLRSPGLHLVVFQLWIKPPKVLLKSPDFYVPGQWRPIKE